MLEERKLACVPLTALEHRDTHDTIALVGDDHTVRKVAVTVVLQAGELAGIEGPFRLGQHVVADGAVEFADGEKIDTTRIQPY